VAGTSSRERRALIVDWVRRQGYATVEALAAEFRVTPQTIRRDINELGGQNLLQRYHGGAGLPSSVENLAYSDRQVLHLEAKQRIARLVARHIPNHSSLFINIGTTTEAVARALLDHVGLRVVTNNLNVASLLCANPSFEVIVTGGLVRARDRGIVGEAALDLIRQFRVDYGVIGISGIDADGSLLDFDYREVRVAQAIIANSRKVLLVADHSKLGRNAMVRLGHVSELDSLFTDLPPPPEMTRLLREAGVALHVAAAEEAPAHG
jgi:DeoR family glycerol-3-phosphate regulon repressor